MNGTSPSSDAPAGAGPSSLAIFAVLSVCVVAPPEVHGVGLAAVALLTTLAVAMSSATSSATSASRWIWAAVPACLMAIRMAQAPGEAVEPAATLLLVAIAGIAAVGVAIPVDRLAAFFGLAVALVSCRALYETFWGLASWAEEVRATVPSAESAAVLNRLEQARPYGGFLTPAALGCFLAMTLPPVAAWAAGRRGSARMAGLGAVALGAAGLIATRSLTAMAALAGALALAALRGRVAPRALAGAALAIGLAAASVGLARPDAVFAPLRGDSPWQLRAGNVRIALEIARAHPLAGVGPGGYAEAFPQYRRAGDNESRHAHDLPAELMAEWGVPAGLALAALFFWLFLAPVLRREGGTRTFSSGLTVGLAAFALHNLFDFTAFLPSLFVFAAISRGLLASPPRVEPVRHLAHFAWIGLALAVAAVAVSSGLAREAIFDARRAVASGDHAAVVRDALRAARLAPWDADPRQLAAEARLASGTGEPGAALEDAEQAVVRAPARPAARWTRARARTALGDSAGAYADLVEAARLYPLRPEYAAQRDALGEALRKAREGAPR